MKTLFLIRHAKSSWDDTVLPDKDRPLDDRGKRDAPTKWATPTSTQRSFGLEALYKV